MCHRLGDGDTQQLLLILLINTAVVQRSCWFMGSSNPSTVDYRQGDQKFSSLRPSSVHKFIEFLLPQQQQLRSLNCKSHSTLKLVSTTSVLETA